MDWSCWHVWGFLYTDPSRCQMRRPYRTMWRRRVQAGKPSPSRSWGWYFCPWPRNYWSHQPVLLPFVGCFRSRHRPFYCGGWHLVAGTGRLGNGGDERRKRTGIWQCCGFKPFQYCIHHWGHIHDWAIGCQRHELARGSWIPVGHDHFSELFGVF